MNRGSDHAVRSMGVAGRAIRMRLKEIYGSPAAAEEAIRERAKDRKSLEDWATITTGKPFSFDDLPGPLREGGAVSMAAAMLVWTEDRSKWRR